MGPPQYCSKISSARALSSGVKSIRSSSKAPLGSKGAGFVGIGCVGWIRSPEVGSHHAEHHQAYRNLPSAPLTGQSKYRHRTRNGRLARSSPTSSVLTREIQEGTSYQESSTRLHPRHSIPRVAHFCLRFRRNSHGTARSRPTGLLETDPQLLHPPRFKPTDRLRGLRC